MLETYFYAEVILRNTFIINISMFEIIINERLSAMRPVGTVTNSFNFGFVESDPLFHICASR